jgi:hypothetical protein
VFGLARQDLPVDRFCLLPAPGLVQLQGLLHILVETQRRLSARAWPGSRTRRSSLISVNGKPAVFVRLPDLSHAAGSFKTHELRRSLMELPISSAKGDGLCHCRDLAARDGEVLCSQHGPSSTMR